MCYLDVCSWEDYSSSKELRQHVTLPVAPAERDGAYPGLPMGPLNAYFLRSWRKKRRVKKERDYSTCPSIPDFSID